MKITKYLHATKGWKKGSPPINCKNVIAHETEDGKRRRLFPSKREAARQRREAAVEKERNDQTNI